MEHRDRVDAVAREAGALVAAVEGGDPAAIVPTCPEYTLDDLAVHVGDFCAFYAGRLCEGAGRPARAFDPDAGRAGRAAWLAGWTGHLVAELRASPPDLEVRTWHPTDRSAGFVARRACHELAVHRVDAQLAAGAAPDAVVPAVAADGIEEVFVLIAHGGARTADRRREGDRTGQTLHLHGTDHRPAEWLITFAPEGVVVERAHGRGDLALRGAVGDLEMLLYQRPTMGEVQRFGDDAVLDVFHREFTFV